VLPKEIEDLLKLPKIIIIARKKWLYSRDLKDWRAKPKDSAYAGSLPLRD